MTYVLVATLSLLLISAQTLWASAVKMYTPIMTQSGTLAFLTTLIQSPRVWLGGLLYGLGTVCYFLLLSKAQFFSVQISMTALAIVLSTVMATVLLHEHISLMNIVGIILVMIGLGLVYAK